MNTYPDNLVRYLLITWIYIYIDWDVDKLWIFSQWKILFLKAAWRFSRKLYMSIVGGEHLPDWAINLYRWQVQRLWYKIVTICTASIRVFRHRYEVTSSQAHIHPQSVLFNEVTIFEAPTRARSVVWANTEARFVSDWPIADARYCLL